MVSFFRWVCDNEPDCGSAPSGKMDVSDEDPARCRGNVTCEGNHFLCKVSIELVLAKFIYCKKVTKFCEIFPLLLSYVVPVKTKGKILQNFVAFSE